MNATDSRLFVIAVISFTALVLNAMQRSRWKWIGVAASILALFMLAIVVVAEHYVKRVV